MTQEKSYSRYFEGFSERKVWDEEKRKYRTERYYAGAYYQAQLTDEEWKRRRQENLAGYLCAVLLFLLAVTREVPSNLSIITAFPTLVILICFVWQIPPLISYVFAKQPLIARQFRERNNFMSMNMGLACIFSLAAAAHLWYVVRYECWNDAREWFVAGAHVINALLFFRLFYTENQTKYTKKENDAIIPEDCFDIGHREN